MDNNEERLVLSRCRMNYKRFASSLLTLVALMVIPYYTGMLFIRIAPNLFEPHALDSPSILLQWLVGLLVFAVVGGVILLLAAFFEIVHASVSGWVRWITTKDRGAK
jgi:hypothetical protein